MNRFRSALVTVLLLACPLSAAAQSDRAYHPYLEDTFIVGLGGFFPNKNFEISANGTARHLKIDFEEEYKIDDTESTWAADFRWRFGEK